MSIVTNSTAAKKAHISNWKESGLYPDGCPKHVARMVASSSAITKPIDPLNGMAPLSVAMHIEHYSTVGKILRLQYSSSVP